jgi:hypothetical protein
MSALADDDEVLLRYGQEETFTNKAWKAVEKDVQHLLEILEEKPEQAGNLGAIHHEGTVYRSKSRNPQWKEVRAVLDRDEITFYKMVRSQPRQSFLVYYAPLCPVVRGIDFCTAQNEAWKKGLVFFFPLACPKNGTTAICKLPH